MRKIPQCLGMILMGALLGLLSACNDSADEPERVDENELITTVNLKFTEQGGATTQTFSYRDPDGDQGKAPVQFDTITLKANKAYTLAIELLDESKTTPVVITQEVAKEQDEHLFVYTITPASLATYTYGDKDSRTYPVGLIGTLKTGAVGAGKFQVQLRHQSPVNGVPIKNGTAIPGSDDVSIGFNLRVIP